MAMRAEAKTMRKITLVLAAMALAVVLAAVPAQADTTFEVDRTDDDADASACTAAANDCSLRGAVIAANAASGADDVINVPAGTYTLNIAGGDIGAATGALGITEGLTINGAGANSTTVAGGAGLSDRIFYNGSDASTIISGLTITGGSADLGGGILNVGTLTVSDSTISGNSVGGFGGGDGGGIYNFGTLTVKQSTISDNEAEFGGGVYANGDVPDTTDRTTITNSTISGNSASISGGGVFSWAGITEIEHSTITNNDAPIGQGSGVKSLDRSTELDFHRTDVLASIISGNINTDDEVNIAPGPDNTFRSEGYNLIDDGDIATGSDEPTDAFDQTGDQTGVSDPGVEPLSLNAPGSTKTHALKESSSALNAGPPTTATECQPPATDQRGVERPQGGACDIGAFELEGPPPDETAPVLNLPDDITQEATGPDGAAVTFTASATDDTDPASPEVVCTKGDPPVAVSSGETFPMGTTTVTCSATDAAGNEATGSFVVKVQDTKGPEITVPADKTVEAGSAQGASVSYQGEVSATDAVDGEDVPVDCSPASGSTFPVGETTVNCEATDEAGNEASKSFNVTVHDATEPTLDLPEDMTFKATGPDGAVANFAPTAGDLVDGSVPVTCSPASGSTFPVGETTVECSAKDRAGNEATGGFKVTVTQTKTALDIKPLTCPNPLSTSATGSYPVAIVGTGALDVSRIDTAKEIKLEGVPAQSLSKGAVKDVATPFAGTITNRPLADQCTKAGADGKQDLNLKFDTQQVVRALGPIKDKEARVLKLTAYLKDGTYVEGEDVVVTNTTSTTKRK